MKIVLLFLPLFLFGDLFDAWKKDPLGFKVGGGYSGDYHEEITFQNSSSREQIELEGDAFSLTGEINYRVGELIAFNGGVDLIWIWGSGDHRRSRWSQLNDGWIERYQNGSDYSAQMFLINGGITLECWLMFFEAYFQFSGVIGVQRYLFENYHLERFRFNSGVYGYRVTGGLSFWVIDLEFGVFSLWGMEPDFSDLSEPYSSYTGYSSSSEMIFEFRFNIRFDAASGELVEHVFR